MTTIVLIPGLLSDHRVWRPLARALEGRHDVAYADNGSHDTIGAMAQAALDATTGDLVAVGHSMGARVAMEMARIAPDRISALVLANTGHHPLQPGETERRQQKIDLGYQSMERLVGEWLPPMVGPEGRKDELLMMDLQEMALDAGPERHERQIRALMNRPDAGATLADIRCPVLLIAATEDGWSPVVQHEEIAAAVHDATLRVIEGAGHFAPAEKPGEVAVIVLDWLKLKGF